MNVIEKDVAIIGAGPSGLFCVFECGFLGYSSVVIDSLPEIGGQLAALYPEKPIYDIPGIPKILAGELVNRLEEQNKPYNPMYLMGHPASDLKKENNGTFTLTVGEQTIKAKVIVIAAGGGMFSPRKPKLENLDPFENTSVFYAVKDKARFAKQEIVIAGGGDSAVDWAVELASVAKHVHVVHRRVDFRAAEATVQQMHALAESGKITLHTPFQPKEILGENGQMSGLKIVDLEKNETTLNATSLLCFYGMIPTLGPLDDWGLEMTPARKIKVERETMQTGVPGVLAVGDIADYAGKISLILVGFAEAASAAKTAQSIIDPDKKFKLVYSTSQGVPDQK